MADHDDAALELLRRQAEALERLADVAEAVGVTPDTTPWRPDPWWLR